MMKETQNQINSIFSVLDAKTSGVVPGLSTTEVMERLLGRKLETLHNPKDAYASADENEITFEKLTTACGDEFVEGIYKRYLGRPADRTGMEQYLSAYLSGTMSKRQIIASIAQSEEAKHWRRRRMGVRYSDTSLYELTLLSGADFVDNLTYIFLGKHAGRELMELYEAGAVTQECLIDTMQEVANIHIRLIDDKWMEDDEPYSTHVVSGQLLDIKRQCQETLDDFDHKCNELLNKWKKELDSCKDEMQKLKQENDDVYTVIDYGDFENAFRGSEEVIKAKQKEYLPYLQGRTKVLDIGCGRGEFLSLLQEEHFNAMGVDLYQPFVEICRGKGLNVVCEDAVEYLGIMDEPLFDAIVGFQIAEHLKPAQLIQLCKNAYGRLSKGGCLILETPNPMCLSTYTNSFYLDPSHVKPIHPKTLQYYMKCAGFSDIQLLLTESSRVGYRLPLLNSPTVSNLLEINDAINGITELIWGSQDYAIIARK